MAAATATAAAAAAAAGAGAGKKVFEVFVSRIPWTLSSREIKEYFGQFGQVKRCALPFDKDTGFHRGVCWIGFSSEEGLQNALQKDPHLIEGSKLQVQKNRKPLFVRRPGKEEEES